MIVKGNIHPFRQLLSLILLGFVLNGCTAPVRAPVETFPVEALPAGKEQRPVRPEDPRELASIRMTDQGRMLLETGRVDEAIVLFERALNISPSNGYNCFYLSEAWILKRDFYQAMEWNELAGINLRDDRTWMDKVVEQKKRIREWMK